MLTVAAVEFSLPMTAGLVAAGAGVVGAAALAYGMFVPQSQLLCKVISHGDPGTDLNADRAVTLTFDDGPWEGAGGTNAILDVLRDTNVQAAFFVIGRYVLQWPDLVRRIHAEGHLIGNHTFDHHRMGLFRGRRYWLDQIARTNDAISAITGQQVKLFRPPMGFKSIHLASAVRRLDMTVVAWSRRGCDGVATTPDRIVRTLTRGTPPTKSLPGGDIVLLHDGRDPTSRRTIGATAQALPTVIANMRRVGGGLSIVRLDKLIDR